MARKKAFPIKGPIELVIARDHFSTSNDTMPDLENEQCNLWYVGYFVQENETHITFCSGGTLEDGEHPFDSEQVDTMTFLRSDIISRKKFR